VQSTVLDGLADADIAWERIRVDGDLFAIDWDEETDG
jgi:hypothetical protein